MHTATTIKHLLLSTKIRSYTVQVATDSILIMVRLRIAHSISETISWIETLDYRLTWLMLAQAIRTISTLWTGLSTLNSLSEDNRLKQLKTIKIRFTPMEPLSQGSRPPQGLQVRTEETRSFRWKAKGLLNTTSNCRLARIALRTFTEVQGQWRLFATLEPMNLLKLRSHSKLRQNKFKKDRAEKVLMILKLMQTDHFLTTRIYARAAKWA